MAASQPVWIKSLGDPERNQIRVYAQPGAKSTQIIGEFNGSLKIKISAPPVDGLANEALTKFIAKKLAVRAKDIVLIQGLSTRQKIFEIIGLTAEEISKKLLL